MLTLASDLLTQIFIALDYQAIKMLNRCCKALLYHYQTRYSIIWSAKLLRDYPDYGLVGDLRQHYYKLCHSKGTKYVCHLADDFSYRVDIRPALDAEELVEPLEFFIPGNHQSAQAVYLLSATGCIFDDDSDGPELKWEQFEARHFFTLTKALIFLKGWFARLIDFITTQTSHTIWRIHCYGSGIILRPTPEATWQFIEANITKELTIDFAPPEVTTVYNNDASVHMDLRLIKLP